MHSPKQEALTSVDDGISGIRLVDLIAALRRRWMIVVILAVCGFLFGFFLSARPRKYQSEGSIRIQPGTAAIYRTSPLAAVTGGSDDKIGSEVAILQSRSLNLDVARELNLANDPAFWGKKSLKAQTLDDPHVRDQVLTMMRRSIAVVHSPKEEIVTISCTTTSSVLSAKIVNTLINDYIEHLFKMRYGATQRSSNWLLGQLDDLKRQIEDDQTRVTQLQGKLGIIGLDEKSEDYLLAQSLTSLNRASSEATVERIIAEAKYRFLKESDPNLLEGGGPILRAPGEGGSDTLLRTLRASQAEAATAYSRLRVQFGPNYPDVKQAKAQLDEVTSQVSLEEQRILNQAKVAYSAASANEQMTNHVLAQQKLSASGLQHDMVTYAILTKDYQGHRALYEGLVQRLREAVITSGLESAEVDIVDLADPPFNPIPPSPAMYLASGLLLGLLAGLIASFLVESLDQSVKNSDQVEKLLAAPLLSIIPHIDSARAMKTPRGVLEVMDAPRSHYSEAIQSLSAALMMAKAGGAPKVVMVTSTSPGEGKSTTARNLAAIFAQGGKRTLLIDCDMRRGRLALSLNSTSPVGLSNVLTQHARIEEAIHPVDACPGLYLLPSGPYPPQPATLISSSQMSELVTVCRDAYDMVILDCPPLVGISDDLFISKLVDAVLFIVRQNITNQQALRAASRLAHISQVGITGFALNDVSHSTGRYKYYGALYKGYYNDDSSEGAA